MLSSTKAITLIKQISLFHIYKTLITANYEETKVQSHPKGFQI